VKKTNQFSLKKIGANVIATLDGKKAGSRKISQEDYEIIVRKVTLYNKKPSETAKNTILKLLSPETTKKVKQKEDTETKIKGYKKLQKKESKKGRVIETVRKDVMEELEEMLETNKDNIGKVEAILAKFKKVEIPVKETSSIPRRGEY